MVIQIFDFPCTAKKDYNFLKKDPSKDPSDFKIYPKSIKNQNCKIKERPQNHGLS